MAAEAETQQFFKNLYHNAMKDGTLPAMGREAVNDVRNTFNEVFFGKGERGPEAGTPLHPTFADILDARNEHEAAVTPKNAPGNPISPADLVARDTSETQGWGKSTEVSPADLKESPTSQQQQEQSTQQDQSPADLKERPQSEQREEERQKHEQTQSQSP
jgi:hypothetical protein